MVRRRWKCVRHSVKPGELMQRIGTLGGGGVPWIGGRIGERIDPWVEGYTSLDWDRGQGGIFRRRSLEEV